MRCRCQHTQWEHTKRGCAGQIRLYAEKPKHSPGGNIVWTVVKPEKLKPKLAKKQEKRGYVTVECECQGFHTIELLGDGGPSLLYGPDGKKLS